MHKKKFLVFLMLLVISMLISGCQGKGSGILTGDTACNLPETWQTRFVVNRDTVTDNQKDLVWTKSAKSGVTWQKATDYCKALTIGGLKWRLPKKGELEAIVSNCPQDNGCRLNSEFDAPCGIFWADIKTTYKDKAGQDVKVYGFVDAVFGGDGYDKADEGHLVKCVSSK